MLGSDEPGFEHELRRKLPRYHWRPLKAIRAGEALADLQRLSLRYGIRLPPSFALVGKTLSQADSIARLLDPELDPVKLLEEDGLDVIRSEAQQGSSLVRSRLTRIRSSTPSRGCRAASQRSSTGSSRERSRSASCPRASPTPSTCCVPPRTASAPR